MKEFLTIKEVASYLQIKKSTLYSKVEKGEIPHYKIGHLLRFLKEDIDAWMEKSKSGPKEQRDKVNEIFHSPDRDIDIYDVVNKAVAEVSKVKYTPKNKGDRTKKIRGLGKEVEDAI